MITLARLLGTLLLGLVLAGPAGAQDGRYLLSESSHRVLSKAHELLGAERYQEAVREVQGLLAQVQDKAYDRAVAQQTLGYAYSGLGDYARAGQAFKAAVDAEALPPEVNHELTYNTAQLLIHSEALAEGLHYLDRWLQAEAKPPAEAYILKATAHFRQGQHKETVASLRKAMELRSPPEESWLQMLLAAYFELNQYKDAASVLEQLVRRHPDNRGYWMQLVGVYQRLEQYHRALATMKLAYEKGMLEQEEDILRLVRTYLFLEIPYKGARLLRSELDRGRVKPSRETLELLANSWLLAQEKDRAVDALKQAAAMDEDGNLSYRVGHLLVDLERWEEARAALGQALDQGGLKEPELANLLLGIAAFRAGDVEGSRQALQRAMAHDRTAGQARYWMERLDAESPMPSEG